jgi:hypothetical protein
LRALLGRSEPERWIKALLLPRIMATRRAA